MLKLYSAELCPFAQRTRALLTHLDIPYARREVDLSNKSAEFVAISPTGKVPLLVDGDTLLYESGAINEYLLDKHAWNEGLPEDPAGRARVRLAMKQFDDVVLPAFYEALERWGANQQVPELPNREKVEAELGVLEKTFEDLVPAGPSLAAFHFAPFWYRIDAIRELNPLAASVDAHTALRKHLAGAANLESVQATSPPRQYLLDRYRGYAIELARKDANKS